MKSAIFTKSLELKEYMTKIRRSLHQYPELGMQEFKTTKLVKKELRSMGIKLVELQSKVGALGILEGAKDGKNRVTALRADMDALPIIEKTELPYSSKNIGTMHACGHDGHTSMLLGAAKLLSGMKYEFSGVIKFIFQPDEENLNGAKLMVKEGVLECPKVDTIVALHCWPALETGKIGVWEGRYMASSDKFTINVIGKGGHGAYPHKSIDAVLAAAQIVVSLQTIISREIDSLKNAVISVCSINGGKTFNVSPEEVTITGTVRSQQSELRNIIKNKIERIIQGIAEGYGCRYKFDYQYGVSLLINHPEVVELISKSTEQVIGKDRVERLRKPAMSSEDFSIYLENVPHGAFIRIGNTDPEKKPLTVHNDHFNFNDDALPVGAAVLTQFVLNRNQ